MSARKRNKNNYLLPKTRISAEEFRSRLKLKHLQAKQAFAEKHPHIEKYLKNKGFDPGKIREQSAKFLGASFLTGSLLMSSPSGMKSLSSDTHISEKEKSDLNNSDEKSSKDVLVKNLAEILPEKPRVLDRREEKYLEQLFIQTMNVNSKATLEGEHLNTTYGYIGAEQHLRRYPGDMLTQHGDAETIKEGIAPGLGAWGYFAPTKLQLTDDLVEKEKWYAVVQTLYLPDWNKRQPYLKGWYKYRKILIVNTDNGNAVVAAIADSGPAAWTGKQFGGSPEVMDYLGGPKYKKGSVIVFFVDDPENRMPFGPVDYSKVNLSAFSY
jgi:hypothetical protein